MDLPCMPQAGVVVAQSAVKLFELVDFIRTHMARRCLREVKSPPPTRIQLLLGIEPAHSPYRLRKP